MRSGGKTLGEVAIIVDKMVIKDRIQYMYKEQARLVRELRAYKRKRGYCGGHPSCMKVTNGWCDECRELYAGKDGERRLTEYGRLRARERREKAAVVAKKRAA